MTMYIEFLQSCDALTDAINAALYRQRQAEVREHYRKFYRLFRVHRATNILFTDIEQSVYTRHNLIYVKANAAVSFSNRRNTAREQGLHNRLHMTRVLGKATAFGTVKNYRERHYANK